MNDETKSPFDNFERTHIGRGDHGESEFAFLNRSAGDEAAEARKRIDKLVEAYPEAGLNHLCARLRSDEDQNFHGAIFELVLYKLLVNLGCEVELCDLDNNLRRPDFLIQHEGKRCYVEATVVDPNLDTLQFNQYEQDVLSKLDTLSGRGIGVVVKMEGTLTELLRKQYVTGPFKYLINAVNTDEIPRSDSNHGHLNGPFAEINNGDWKLTGHLITIDSDRFVHQIDRMPIRIAPEKAILRRLEDKAKRYRQLDAPFIIAVNARELGFGSRDDAIDALYGKRSSNMSWDYNTIPPSLVPDGVVRSSGGIWFMNDGEPRYNRVTGAMFFERLDPYKLAVPMMLYLNPNLIHHYIPDVLYRLPHAIEEDHELRFNEDEYLESLLKDVID